MSPKITASQKEQRRRLILDAAKRIFAAKGFAAATLKDIVEEAGMSRGWIYLYFQTKEEIFEALLDLQDEEYERYLDELVRASDSVWQAIRTLNAQELEELAERPDTNLMPVFYEYFLGGWRDEARRKLLLRRYEQGIERFAKLLQLGVDRGEFAPSMPLADISRLVASYQEGIMSHSFAVGPERARTAVQIEALTQYLQRLLMPG